MSRTSRILCAVDFSRPAKAVFEQALALSRARNAELTAVRAIPVRDRFNWNARERLARTAALQRAAAAAGVRLRVTEQHGDPAGVILLHANTGRFDLIVLGTHARTGLARLRDGSIAEQVTKRSRCPVLVVPVPKDTRLDLARFDNLVCAVDFTKGSDRAVRQALQLVKGGGRLTLVHVSRAAGLGVATHGYNLAVPEYAHRLHHDAWRRMRDAVPIEARMVADIRARVTSGAPATEITRVASELDADLIVMGVTARGVVGRTLIGSTVARVIRTAGRPVLAVPERLSKRLDVHMAPERRPRLAA